MEVLFNSFKKEKKLAEPIMCYLCGKEIHNIMDSHDPEPLANKPNKICNVCNEDAVAVRLQSLRESGL